MEAVLLICIFALYILLRLALGGGETATCRQMKKHKEGLEMLRLRNYESAFHYFDLLVDQEPHNALAHAMRGRCYLEMDKYENALIDAAKAIKLDNTFSHPYLTKGRALYEMGMLHEAVLEFEKAVWYSRKDSEGYRWRGLVHCRLGYHVHGESDLKKAVELGDENAQYLLRRRDDVKIWGNQKY